MRHSIVLLGLTFSIAALSSSHAQESEFYKTPTNVKEFWRAVQFEISIGKFDIAADHLKGLLDQKPNAKELLEIEAKDGLVPFLRLRNVDRWSRDKKTDATARQNVEALIKMIGDALKEELSNPDRIAKFAKNLTATPEEAAFAQKELIRSGVDAIPVLIDILRGNRDAALRSAILQLLPRFDIAAVPPIVAALDVNDAVLKLELLDAIRNRRDYLTLPSRVETDVVPILWYFSAPLKKNPEPLRKKAREMLFGLLDRDPASDRIVEHRTEQYNLTQIARTFLDHRARFSNRDQVVVWKWDGAKPVAAPLSITDAEEYYGLRYARWALDVQADNFEAQKVFLTIALDKHFARAGVELPLVKTSPALYGILATAPYELLNDLLETCLRDRRGSSAVAVIQIIGDRSEEKAVRPSDKPGSSSELRPSLLIKALDYPDRKIQFAAADALLRTPQPHTHRRGSQIVKILGGFLQADPPEAGSKPKAMIGDRDRARGEALASVLRRAGFDAEIVRTGRDAMRRLQGQPDIDIVVVDRHIPGPMLPDFLAQVRADFRSKCVPLLVVASPDRPTTAHPITLLARLAALAAADEHIDFVKAQDRDFDSRREAPSARFKKRLDTLRRLVESAGIAVTTDVEDRLEYLSFLAAPVEEINLPVDKPELAKTRLFVPLSERFNRMRILREDPKKGHIAPNEPPFANTKDLTVPLAQVVSHYEMGLSQEVLDVAKVYWEVIQTGQVDKEGKIVQEALPGVAIRYPEIEARLNRLAKNYRQVRIIPEVFTELAVKEELRGFVKLDDPKLVEAEKKNNAKAALEWLRLMALGELTGYPVIEAETAIRQALQKPELSAQAIDIVGRFASKEAQQDLANVVLGNLAADLRARAAEALIKHIQLRGKMITDPQRQLLLEKVATETEPIVKTRLLALKGILSPNATETGDRLRSFIPTAPAPVKEDPKNKKEELKDQ